MKRLLSLILVISLLLGATGCTKKQELVESKETFIALDTVISIIIFGENESKNQEILKQSRTYTEDLERIFSRTIETSEVSKINQAKAGEPITLSPPVQAVIQTALDISAQIPNTFDITIGSVTSLWDFSSGEGKVPEHEKIERVLPFIGHDMITLQDNVLTKKYDEVTLDLGGIAKGYIGDLLKDFFEEAGVPYGLVNLGGDVVAIGTQPPRPWKIGITEPFSPRGELAGYVEITENALVTSGTYERYFEENGTLYHHILNPLTGYPADTELTSVTVVANSTMVADMLATICFLVGPEDAIAFLESSQLGECMMFDKDGTVHTSQNFPEFHSIS